MKAIIAVMFLVLPLFLACKQNKPIATKQAFQSWEYKIAGFQDKDCTDSLTAYGLLGWEIVSARRTISDNGSYEFVFKKPMR